MIPVAVVAPTLAVRAGLRALVNTDESFRVAAEAATLEDMLPVPEEIEIVVIVIETTAFRDLIQILEEVTSCPTLFLFTAEADEELVLSLPESTLPTWGILPLDSSQEELSAAMIALHEGLTVLAPSFTNPIFSRLPRSARLNGAIPSEQRVEPLTERETQVLQLVAEGLANKQIAISLGISEHTVKFHVSAIIAKLGATSRTDAVRQGVRQGLIVL